MNAKENCAQALWEIIKSVFDFFLMRNFIAFQQLTVFRTIIFIAKCSQNASKLHGGHAEARMNILKVWTDGSNILDSWDYSR